MNNLKKEAIKKLLELDQTGQYQLTINKLAIDDLDLLDFNYKTAAKSIDPDVLLASKIFLESINKSNEYFKKSIKKKEDLDFFTRFTLKTLKTAQTLLAGLLPKSPFKVGVAYNAIHWIIRFVEQEMRKKSKEQLEKEKLKNIRQLR